MFPRVKKQMGKASHTQKSLQSRMTSGLDKGSYDYSVAVCRKRIFFVLCKRKQANEPVKLPKLLRDSFCLSSTHHIPSHKCGLLLQQSFVNP